MKTFWQPWSELFKYTAHNFILSSKLHLNHIHFQLNTGTSRPTNNLVHQVPIYLQNSTEKVSTYTLSAYRCEAVVGAASACERGECPELLLTKMTAGFHKNFRLHKNAQKLAELKSLGSLFGRVVCWGPGYALKGSRNEDVDDISLVWWRNNKVIVASTLFSCIQLPVGCSGCHVLHYVAEACCIL